MFSQRNYVRNGSQRFSFPYIFPRARPFATVRNGSQCEREKLPATPVWKQGTLNIEESVFVMQHLLLTSQLTERSLGPQDGQLQLLHKLRLANPSMIVSWNCPMFSSPNNLPALGPQMLTTGIRTGWPYMATILWPCP